MKNQTKHIIFSIAQICIYLSAIIYNSCIEPFEPEIDKFNEILVIEGYLTTEKASGKVIISKNYSYNDSETDKIDDAIVFLVDDLGNYFEFNYSKSSNYTIKDTTFAAEIGRSYKIHIELNNGEICESTFSEVIKPVEFDTLHYAYTQTGDMYSGGLQFYVDLKNNSSEADYFYWDYVETWEFKVPLQSKTDQFHRTCYRYKTSNEFNIKSTYEFSNKDIKSIPLFFISSPTEKFGRKYSVIVNQHTISKNDYQFYKKLKESHEESGTLYDKTPNALIGNITYLHDDELPILGNFRVSSLSSKRIFLNTTDLPRGMELEDEFNNCADAAFKYPDYEDIIETYLGKMGWVIMEIIPDAGLWSSTYVLATSAECFDCTITGTEVKPKFWDNE